MNELVKLPVSVIFQHPDNPRKELGDLAELADSIKANGIMQNLTVVTKLNDDGAWDGSTYTVVIGHRRLAAAKLAGLTEVPCVVAEMSEKEQLRTMLMENMQRSDLTVYEQAQGFQLMIDMGETAESVAELTGFSTTTVRRRLKMAELDQKLLKDISDRQISMADFDKLAKLDSLEDRNACLNDIGTGSFNQAVETRLRKQEVAKRLPALKKALKEIHANKLVYSQCYSGKYTRISPDGGSREIQISEWNADDPLVPEGETRKLYYYLDDQYGRLSIYVERPKPEPVKKTKAELEKERLRKEAWNKADELSEIAFKLRTDFVAGLTVTTKNMKLMLKAAMSASVLRAVAYISTDSTALKKAIDYPDSCSFEERERAALKALENAGESAYPTIVHTAFGDRCDLGYIDGYRSYEMPKHKDNAQLNAIYDWLTSLGYQMSDDEKALQDGTHEVFHRGEKS